MSFVPRALIDHAALRHNLQRVRQFAPASLVMAVIKANAYGHGMVEVAQSLEGADGFAVARLEEAIRLREGGIGQRILILGGVQSGPELVAAARHRCDLVVHQPHQIEFLERGPQPSGLRIWLKVDTGMHRLGFRPVDVPGALRRLSDCPGLAGPPVLMTHLSNADDPTDPLTERQCAMLRAFAAAGNEGLSIGNSAGLIAFPLSRSGWVRPGIMLYGSSPFRDTTGAAHDLRPVMTLRTRLVAVRRCRKGDGIGYSGTYVCPEDMPVGVAAIGYGDGYPRHAPSGTPVLVGGRRVPLIGRVSMDLITLDLRSLFEARVGDPVTLWGEGLAVEEVARSAGTISYELLCGISSRVAVEHLNRDAEARTDGRAAEAG